MTHNYWLLVIMVLVYPLPVPGQEACYEDSWAYHNHSYSCFKLFNLGMRWAGASDYCRDIQSGSTYGVMTHLAKIDDSDTDDFVRNLAIISTGNQNAWIGLYNDTDKNAFRWDGYPDETPKYTAASWEWQSLPRVLMVIDGWRGQISVGSHRFVCQQPAKSIGVVTCAYHIDSARLDITCTSERSPVKAKCQWTHKYDIDTDFGAWSPVTFPSHESITEHPEGDTSYTTHCSATVLDVRVGTFMFLMKMYPDISGLDLSTNEEALTIGSLNIDIDPPHVPQLKALGGKTMAESSTVVCVEDDLIDLVCHVNSGNPLVDSVTMSCEFPLSDSDEGSELTMEGTDFVINKTVSRDIHGKVCTCIGNHLTGQFRSSPLTFLVVSKPSDVTCSINLLSYGLKVSCEIGKVFPEASCQWFYHNEDDLHSTSVSKSQMNDYSHQEFTDVDGSVYYKSICSVTLTPEVTTLRTGHFTVKVKIIPDLHGMYLSMTNDTSTNTQEIVSICKYINCFFLAALDFPLTASVIQQHLEPLDLH